MAMPVAMGIEGTTSKLDKATIASGSPPRVDCPSTIIQASVQGSGGGEPFDLLALVPPRPAEADKQRDHGPEPGQK